MTITTLLRESLPTLDLIEGDDISERYQHDWSAETPGVPVAVARPASPDELSRILAICNQQQQTVVVQGGLTGLCGGGNPGTDELSISLEKLVGIEELDRDSMTMTVLAGTPLQVIQEAAEEAGFIFPLDLGARGTCNIGGNISTNAGGNQVLRYGMTRNLVLGLEAVTANGTVISAMNKMLKNNAGYDLKQLFIGTEGTLGIVSRAVLRLFPRSTTRNSALLAVNSFPDVVTCLHTLGRDLAGTLSSFEVMWDSYFHFITDNVENAVSPFDTQYPIYILTEMEGGDEQNDAARFENTLASLMESGTVVDAVLANSERERDGFWQIRDGVGDISWFIKDSANFDVSIPISLMDEFLAAIDTEIMANFPQCQKLVFGHIGDSNLHIICVTGNREDIKTLYSIVYGKVGEFGGSVSAEHGIGIQKLNYLSLSRDASQIELMRMLKQTMDPNNILNPGRVIPPE